MNNTLMCILVPTVILGLPIIITWLTMRERDPAIIWLIHKRQTKKSIIWKINRMDKMIREVDKDAFKSYEKQQKIICLLMDYLKLEVKKIEEKSKLVIIKKKK